MMPRLTVAYINCRGVKSRLDKVNEYLQGSPIHVMVLAETWLKEGEAAPRFAGFDIVVDERGVVGERASRASGGLILLARRGVPTKSLSSNRRMAVIEIGGVRITGCYFSPYVSGEKAQEAAFRREWRTIEEEILMNPSTIVVGDFNAHGLQGDQVNYPRGSWLRKQLAPEGAAAERVAPVQGKYTTFNYQGRGINDHVFTSRGNPLEAVVKIDEQESLGGSDHRLMTIELDPQQPLVAPVEYLRWDFKRIAKQKTAIYEELIRSDPRVEVETLARQAAGWARERSPVPQEERGKLIDQGWGCIKRWLEAAVSKSAKRRVVSSTYRKDFLTPTMTQRREDWRQAEKAAQQATTAGANKSELQRLWRIVGDHAQWWAKRTKRRRITVFTKVVDSMYKDPGVFQKMVSCLKKREARDKGKCKLDEQQMSTHSKYFEGTFGADPTGNAAQVDRELLERTCPDRPQCCEAPEPATQECIEHLAKLIREMPNNKAAGCDELPGELWKLLAPLEECTKTLVMFFHLAEALGVTPGEWKMARVVPIYKNKGDPSSISNYRPIALTLVVRRIFEKYIIQRRLMTIVDKLAHTQGGFRPHRSTIDQVIILHEILCRLPASAVIFLDIKAAYDTVDRRLLWTRMKRDFDVDERTISLMRDMFDSNVALLVVKGRESEAIPLKRGLLQGSSISPLLFNIFINELLTDLQRLPKIRMGGSLWNHLFFADDGALVATNNSDADKLLRCAVAWSKNNGITFAIPKCQFIATPGYQWDIKMDGVPLEQVADYKYLGVFTGPQGINFEKSIKHRADSCSQMVQWMCSKGMNTSGWRLQQSITVYKSFLRSMMEYGLCLKVLPQRTMKILQKVQNAALRRMLNANKSTSIGAMHIVTEIEPLSMRNIELHARFFNEVFNGARRDLPVGQVVRSLYVTKGPRNSLVEGFKKSSPWIREVVQSRLPSVADLKARRSSDLRQFQASLHDAASRNLLPPRGPHRNNLLKCAYLLPRPFLKEIYSFKLGKIPRQECMNCGATFTAEHLFSCGKLKGTLVEITIKHNLKPLQGKGAASLCELLRRLDGMKKPLVAAYHDIGEGLIQAKQATLASQHKVDSEEIFSDDERPEDPFNVLLESKLGSSRVTEVTVPTVSLTACESLARPQPQWKQAENLQCVQPARSPDPVELPVTDPTDLIPDRDLGIIRFFYYDLDNNEKNLLMYGCITMDSEHTAARQELVQKVRSAMKGAAIFKTVEGVQLLLKWIQMIREYLWVWDNAQRSG
jgi:ribosomal protein S27AE